MLSTYLTSQVGAEHRRDLQAQATASRRTALARCGKASILDRALGRSASRDCPAT